MYFKVLVTVKIFDFGYRRGSYNYNFKVLVTVKIFDFGYRRGSYNKLAKEG